MVTSTSAGTLERPTHAASFLIAICKIRLLIQRQTYKMSEFRNFSCIEQNGYQLLGW
jgi:hypothetical protein